MSDKTAAEITAALAAYFDADEVKWKAQAAKGDRALAVAYIDARCVMDRLDEVVGVGGWQDEYTVLPDGNVYCRLSLRFGGEWLTKGDVGGQSEQPDDGDKVKAAFSDALKRAAVKFGVGRYLYRLPHQWVDYDAQRRQLRSKPSLPAWALPAGAKKPAAQPQKPEKVPNVPADGKALATRLRKFSSELKLKGLFSLDNELTRLVEHNGQAEGFPARLEDYTDAGSIEWACHEAVRLATDRGWKVPERKVG